MKVHLNFYPRLNGRCFRRIFLILVFSCILCAQYSIQANDWIHASPTTTQQRHNKHQQILLLQASSYTLNILITGINVCPSFQELFALSSLVVGCFLCYLKTNFEFRGYKYNEKQTNRNDRRKTEGIRDDQKILEPTSRQQLLCKDSITIIAYVLFFFWRRWFSLRQNTTQ